MTRLVAVFITHAPSRMTVKCRWSLMLTRADHDFQRGSARNRNLADSQKKGCIFHDWALYYGLDGCMDHRNGSTA